MRGAARAMDIVENSKRLEPDLLFLTGDQIYDHYLTTDC